MSDCIHCDIHELLETRLQNQEVNLAEIVATPRLLPALST